MTSHLPHVKLEDMYSFSNTCTLLEISPNTLRRYQDDIGYVYSINNRKYFKGANIIKFYRRFYNEKSIKI